MQKIVAVSNLVGYYVIGLPVGVALMFYAELGIKGKIQFFKDFFTNAEISIVNLLKLGISETCSTLFHTTETYLRFLGQGSPGGPGSKSRPRGFSLDPKALHSLISLFFI